MKKKIILALLVILVIIQFFPALPDDYQPTEGQSFTEVHEVPIQVEAMAVRFRLFLAEAEDSQAEVALEVLAEVASVVAEPVEVGNFQ